MPNDPMSASLQPMLATLASRGPERRRVRSSGRSRCRRPTPAPNVERAVMADPLTANIRSIHRGQVETTRTSTLTRTYPNGAYITATTKPPHRGAIRSGDGWRTRAETLWICEHRHAIPDDATACALEEMRRGRLG